MSSTSKIEHGQRRRANRRNDGELDEHREHNLDRVEAQPCRHVKFQIGMMHAMQPPQRRHRMKQHVLEVDREVEHEDRGEQRKPIRQPDHVQQAEAARLGHERKTDSGRGKQNSQQQRVDDHHTEIVRPTPRAPDRLLAPRHNELQDGQHDEDAAERGEPDHRFVCEREVTHGLRLLHLLDRPARGAIIQLND